MIIGSALMQKGEQMRLIDADLLGLTDIEIIMCDGDYKEALKMLINKIENAPTIEPEQTRKWTMVGKWIIRKNTKNAMCPSCHKSFKDVYDMDNYDHYCRHCGLAMDGIINE